MLANVGMPARGALVTAGRSDGASYSAYTDADGRYRISGLPAGSYEVRAQGGAFVAGAALKLNVAVGATISQQNLAVTNGAQLSGVVSGPGGPLAGATVIAVGANGLRNSAVTRESGAYTMTGLTPQSYMVSASAAGMVTASGTPFLLSSGGATGVNLTLAAGGLLTGTITSQADGAPAAFVQLRLEAGGQVYAGATGPDGIYTVTGLPAGNYTVATLSDKFMAASSVKAVTASAASVLNFSLAPRGVVSGTVTNTTTGQALAKVIVHAMDDSGLVAFTTTDATGKYRLEGFEAGSYRVILGDPLAPGIKTTSIVLNAANRNAAVDFATAVAGTVSGTVYAADGTMPLAGASVQLKAGTTDILAMNTNAQGQYSFVVTAAGTYDVAAFADGLVYRPLTGVAIAGGAERAGRNFVPGTERISGQVKNAAGAAMPGLDVILSLTDAAVGPLGVVSLITDVNGAFSIANAVTGAYRVDVRLDGSGILESQTFNVTAGSAATMNLTTSLGDTLRGRVRGASTSAPIAGALVSVFKPGETAAAASATSTTNGEYRLIGLAPGPGLPSGTAIHAEASIVFGINAPIATPRIVNTLDIGAPTSAVAALPAKSNTPNFDVSWSGSDDAGGSGIAAYDVFVSDNGGPFEHWLVHTTQTSAMFEGEYNHTYAFYSVAVDRVGLAQPAPAGAQATTAVGPESFVKITKGKATAKSGVLSKVDLTFSGPLRASSAKSLSSYKLVQAGKDKRFGTRDDVTIKLKSAAYNTTTRTVTIVTKSKLKLDRATRLYVLGAKLLDSLGRRFDGDRDGKAGGDYFLKLK